MTHEEPGLREALKRVGVALKESTVPFALAGGYAAWARGGPEPGHDVDFLVDPDDAERAAEELSRRGLEVYQPPEDWLFKVSSDGEVVDVLHRAASGDVQRLLDDADVVEVISVELPVISATGVVLEKLLAMEEHYCDFGSQLPVMRALREQVDWGTVRAESKGHAFAEAMLFLLDRLEILPS